MATGRPAQGRVDFHIGGRIRLRRAELGLTQEDLAGLLGISYQQVQKYEAGTNRVSAARLFEIAHALNADLAHFFDGYDGTARRSPLPHGGHNRAAIELVRNFLDLKDGTLRSAVTTLLRALHDQKAHRPAGD